ncbi:MAG: hypothetical protein ACD_4C00267G0006 [uncultured bacterium (gcode 4)]|uniref:Uncharacterized protein n=1 Tax=uncultured bacterium (gcode 4) TaxID=1234023 RepID=K2FU86_9BACT|nr:MAG: hypothetical protein ACD_4C00267G0006 [uncultured bacterium (gcode 4)]
MKQIFENKIINIDESIFDNRFLFKIASNCKSDFDVDIWKLLLEYKNENLNYKKDYKLWNEVYSPKSELEIFEKLLEDNIKNNKKIHISNISLQEEVQIIKDIYLDLGYFNVELNKFEIDFKNSPVTLWVNINNLMYSFKDYNRKKEEIFFIPPPREPRHQKNLKSGINSWVVSTIQINNNNEEFNFLKDLINEEKINLLKLWRNLFYNYKKIGFVFDESEIIIEMN